MKIFKSFVKEIAKIFNKNKVNVTEQELKDTLFIVKSWMHYFFQTNNGERNLMTIRDVQINSTMQNLIVEVYTTSPGSLIGKGGSYINQLQNFLQKRLDVLPNNKYNKIFFGKKIEIKIVEVPNLWPNISDWL